MKKIGFIGLGVMGKPMALNLLKAGYRLVVYDINPVRIEELAARGASAGKSPADVAAQVEIVLTMLPNSPEVKEVILGEEGVLAGFRRAAAPAGRIIVDMSSIDPNVAGEIAADAGRQGVGMLDAPVSGGEPKAVDGTLSMMVGGEKELFEQVRNILQAMAKSVVLVGGIGSGNTTKLANQIIVALNIIAVSEALVFAKKAGVDPEIVYQAVRGGLAGSTVLDAKAPLMLKRHFTPGFRIELHLKDLLNAMDAALQAETPLLFTSQAVEILKTLKSEGKGGLDHGGIVQFFEKIAGVEV